MTGARLAFVDCETTGLDPARHEIWELAIITVTPWDAESNLSRQVEYEWQLPVDLAKADPTGLRIGRFYDRRRKLPTLGDPTDKAGLVRWPDSASWDRKSSDGIARDVAVLLDGVHMVGAVPSFDAAFLTRWLNAHGQAATWHYHLICSEVLAAGWLAGVRAAVNEKTPNTGEAFWLGSRAWEVCEGMGHEPPWRSDDLSRAVGIDPERFDRHTALGDARWAKAIYEAVMGS